MITFRRIKRWLQSKSRFKKQRVKMSCKHLFGDCKRKCPWCGVYGFFAYYSAGERDYKLCKWCGKCQDFGQEAVQCYWEVCRQCYPKFDGTHSKGYKPIVSDSKEKGMRLTMSVGHPCPVDGTTMTLLEYKVNPMQPWKDKIYKEHGYK